MKNGAIKPQKMLLRCIAMQRSGYWVAMCIDLDLVAQASTAAAARKLLKDQINSYVADAFGEDQEHASYLLTRRAPLRYFATYYASKLWHYTKKRQSYDAILPMSIAGA